MRTAEDCRRKAAEMNELATKSPTTRNEFLDLAEGWTRMAQESAQAEGASADEPVQPPPGG
jgi:hypothetical protein